MSKFKKGDYVTVKKPYTSTDTNERILPGHVGVVTRGSMFPSSYRVCFNGVSHIIPDGELMDDHEIEFHPIHNTPLIEALK